MLKTEEQATGYLASVQETDASGAEEIENVHMPCKHQTGV